MDEGFSTVGMYAPTVLYAPIRLKPTKNRKHTNANHLLLHVPEGVGVTGAK